MNNEVETIKKQFKETMDRKGEWAPLYTKLMQTVYAQPVLFVALSRENYDKEAKTSVPLICTKDFGGKPAIYVFSDIGLAEIWMKALSTYLKTGRSALSPPFTRSRTIFCRSFRSRGGSARTGSCSTRAATG
ncbi:MAG: hypothetical protein J5879_03800 [Clostridia bacterium]|nr:hypothetical protein [Clostridia bacterium]